jgi:hypothetical protein
MKQIYFLLIALCFFATTKAQIVNIPDAKFKAKLLAASTSNTTAKNISGNYFKIDANASGEIEESEALSVYQLDLNMSNISNLAGIEYFKKLSSLICSNNNLTNLNVLALTQLTNLHCGGNKITSLDLSSLTVLRDLYCSSNQLSAINISNLISLQSLSCAKNNIQILDLSGTKYLNTIECNSNKLTSLNLTGLKYLWNLYCGNNLLTSLDLTGLINLGTLECENNKISNIDLTGLVNLTFVNCGGNPLGNLDLSSNTKLYTLNCQNNQLQTLNLSGLTSLYDLNCSSNQLLNLSLAGLTKFQTIDISGNQMMNVDLSGLTELLNFNCNMTKITDLNLSESSKLAQLYCYNNTNLTNLNIKNNSQEIYLDFGSNLNLKYICADDNEINSIQGKINNYGYKNCNVNSYCSFVPGGTNYTIQGNQKFDSNTNGCDALDVVVPNIKFNLVTGATTGSLTSNSTGNYSIPVQAGTHVITPVIENPTYFNVSPASSIVTFPTQTSPFAQDFCVTANGTRPDLEVSLLPLQPARPGFDAKYKIIFKNKGTTTQSGSVNLAFDDAVLDLVVSHPLATTQTTNNLSWNFTNLLPFETREITFTLNVNSPMEIPAVNDSSVLVYNATITSTATDETPTDNTFTFNQTVVNSFDPNDKTCLEGTTISPSLIGQYVHYMIRFENTGTFPAQNIVVKDMIDLSKFDISTLVPINASHSYITKIYGGNKVEFIFENINLPFDDANNDGYITFKIKTLPTLVVGNTFTNAASIYFDYNFPVVTKLSSSTFKTLSTQDFEFSNYFTLYPNPAKSVLNISAKETIEVQSISIYNTLGQLVLVVPNAEKVSKMDVSSLKTGNYFIKINSDKGSSNTRFIKE